MFSADHGIWTKICGIRDPQTALAVAAFQPDAVGLNFHARSVRFVTDETAAEIAALLPPTVAAIGVFVDEPLDDVVRRVREIPLSGVQFHGDESAEFLARFHRRCPQTWILRAFRRSDDGLTPLVVHLADCRQCGVPLTACLLDAHSPSAYGGTGTLLPWQDLRQELNGLSLPPVVLAGGLRPGNVAEALNTVRPRGVDVASGVESAPGVKDARLVAEFLQQIRNWRPD